MLHLLDLIILILKDLGKSLGLIFQITDDLLEIESTEEKIGKSTHSDADKHKATYPSILGIKKTRETLASHLDRSLAIIHSFDTKGLLESFLFLISNPGKF